MLFFGLVATLYLLRREPIRRVEGLRQGLVALLGSYIMLPVAIAGSEHADLLLLVLGDALMIYGTAGAVFALAHLGRCFGIFPEARGLVTSGPYRLVRHPMYLFEFVAFLGVLLPNLNVLNVTLYAAFACFQLSRMAYEEQVLRSTFPLEYPAYAAQTRRLVPGIY
jgi:protein-S-isoprenylcysteine O-methyltransferase Ste14